MQLVTRHKIISV